MTALSIQVPFPVFQDRDGQPLDNGYVWIGEPNVNPQTNPVVAYYDEALTIIAAQPLRTINGYVSRSGTPAQIYFDGVNFSILVQDSKGSLVYSFAEGTGISADASGITYDPPFTGSVPTNVEAKLAQTVSVNDFGAVGDGVTDDTNAFQAAINSMSLHGGGTVTFTNRHLIDANLFIRDYVTLEGPLGLPDELLPGNTASYETQSGVLIINSAATISVLDGASIGNCLVIRKGLDLPFINEISATIGVAAFSGTAFTVGGAGAYFHHLLILGFNQAIYSINNERVRCEYVLGDNTNGIHIETCFDISYVDNCHFWPWTTTHQSWTTGTLLTRSGCAYRFRNIGDWNKFTNCFSYGYNLGFDIDSCDHTTLIGCGTDYFGGLSASHVGTQIKGTSANTALIRHQAAAQGTGVEVNTTAATGAVVTFVGCDFWDNDIQHVVVNRGRAIIDSCTFRSGVAGVVAIGNNPMGVQIINCDFELTTTPINVTDKALERSTFFGNRFFNCVTSQGIRIVSDNQPEFRYDSCYNSSGVGPSFFHRASRGDIAGPIAVQDLDIMSKISANGYDGQNFQISTAIRSQVNGIVNLNSVPGQIIFSTVKQGEITLIDRIALKNNGNFLPLTDNAYSLGESGFRWSQIWAANGTIQTSDERTKTNIQDSALGLNFIESLRPVSYKFKVGGNEVIKQIYRDKNNLECLETDPDAKPAEIITKEKEGVRTHWGFLAQEVKLSSDKFGVDFGGWIKTDISDSNSEEGLRYEELIAPLIKAVQELAEKVKILENK